MAHIPDGLLSAPVLIAGGVIAVAGVGAGLRRIDEATIMRAAVLSALFFCLSLVAVPVGPSSVHLLLAALMAMLIGPAVFPAVLVGLSLQALFFGFGGLTTLGVNTANIALPGFVAGLAVRALIAGGPAMMAMVAAGLGAALAVAGTAAMVALSLALSASEFLPSAKVLGITYLPLMLGEGVVTAFAVGFLRRVRPDLFEASLLARTA